MNAKTIKETSAFRLYRAGRQFRLSCKLSDHHPKGRQVSAKDANYLAALTGATFDYACVIDMGVGVFR